MSRRSSELGIGLPHAQFKTGNRNHSDLREPHARHTRRASRSREPLTTTAACSSTRCSPLQRGHGAATARSSTRGTASTTIGRSGEPPGSSLNRRSRFAANAAAARSASRRAVLGLLGFFDNVDSSAQCSLARNCTAYAELWALSSRSSAVLNVDSASSRRLAAVERVVLADTNNASDPHNQRTAGTLAIPVLVTVRRMRLSA